MGFISFFTLFSHANLCLSAGVNRVLRYLLVTPDLHRMHRSARSPETDSNFGAVFPIWDIVFRTFRREPQGGYDGMRIVLGEVRGRRANQRVRLLRRPFARELPRDDRGRPAAPEPVLGLPTS